MIGLQPPPSLIRTVPSAPLAAPSVWPPLGSA